MNSYINQLLTLYKEKKLDQSVAYTLIDEYKRSHSGKSSPGGSNKIAVIGIACRMPMADHKDAFWENLRNGANCVRPFPESRRKNVDHLADQIPSGHFRGSGKYWEAGFLDHVDTFDNEFFKILPGEARIMDPQQRLFLEIAHDAFQDAGYTRKDLQGSNTGVFLGDVVNEYRKIIHQVNGTAVVGNISPFITSRVSYFYNLHGPTVNISTTCSTSLVAIHEACQSLLMGECKMALAGAINLRLFPFDLIDDPIDALGIVSESGKCRAFDNQADGIVRGEGGGALVLKRYEDAVEDRDFIYGIILGSGVNNDGRSSSVGAPNPLAQEKLLTETWKKCGINPRTLDYFEAHGTGTRVGDPIEIQAINRAFAPFTKDKQFCGIGSVKTNLGHLTGGASGLASLIKVLLSLHHKEIPPSIHFEEPNDLIDFTNTPVYIVNRLEEWKRGDHPRRAAVSAFGFNGTNCHLVVQEEPEATSTDPATSKPHLFLISSETEEGLKGLAARYLDFMKKNENGVSFSDICYTLSTGRDHYRKRAAIISDSYAHTIAALEKLILQPTIEGLMENAAADENIRAHGLAYCQGALPDFASLFPGKSYRKIPLPTYAYRKSEFWIESLVLKDDDKSFEREERTVKAQEGRGDPLVELRGVFKDIMGITSIQDNDSFFDLGGDSLLGVQLLNEIHRRFNKKLSFENLFENPTIALLLPLIHATGENGYHAILPAEQSSHYPLSFSQRRLWILHHMQDDPVAYNMYECYRFEGMLDEEAFIKALDSLMERHLSLRTVFKEVDGEPFQHFLPEQPFSLSTFQGSEKEILARIENFKRVPFDMQNGPLVKGLLAKSSGGGTFFFLMLHHIISDGSSLKILFDDLLKSYSAIRKKAEAGLNPLSVQYVDYCSWQRSAPVQERMKAMESYWLNKFSGTLAVCEILGDKVRPAVFNFKGKRKLFAISGDLLERLTTFAQERRATLFMTLLSTVYGLIYRFTGQKDLIVGSPVSGRSHYDLREIPGLFVNTLALRCRLESHETFNGLLEKVKQDVLESLECQDYPFDQLIDKLNLQRDTSRSPLFNINVALQNFDVDAESKIALQDLSVKRQELPHHSCKWDLEFEFIKRPEGDLECYVEYYDEIYSEPFIENLIQCYLNLAEAFLDNPGQLLSKAEAAPAAGNIVNDEVKIDSPFKSLHEVFELQAKLYPELPAIKDGAQDVSYEELNSRANQVAHYLRNSAGAVHEERVGIYMENSIEAIVAILGILKAGSAYVPFDVKAPVNRVKEIVSQAGVRTILSKGSYAEFLNKLQWEVPAFERYLLLDADSLYRGTAESSSLMDEHLWDQVAKEASDEITSSGWVKSDTGESFSKQEMEEYKQNVLLKLLPHVNKTTRVLEIGCGSGLTLFSLAPYVGHYTGTDLSGEIIRVNRKKAEQEGFRNVSFQHMKAHELPSLLSGDYDLVIINSVVHCFPGLGYLKHVLKLAIEKMKGSGLIFLGDLMDQELKGQLVDYMKEFREKNRNKGYRTKLDWEQELFVSRKFLDDLQADYPAIVDMEYTLKHHTIPNELTRFRYDALLKIDKRNPLSVSPRRKNKTQHDNRALKAFSKANLNLSLSQDALAYVLFTSGSTGKPKGVMVNHRTVVNYIEWCNKKYFLDTKEKPRFHFFSPLTFDLTVTSIFCPLFTGSFLRVHKGEFDEVLESIRLNQDCNIIKMTPSHLGMLLETGCPLPGLKKFILGGEALHTTQVEKYSCLAGTAIQVYNEYGPTEATVGCIEFEWQTGSTLSALQIPIGKPIANVVIHLLDENLCPVPLGGIGEIYIGGSCLARGYLDAPELTNERFLPDPYSKTGQRMYKTGDLGRLLPDGNMEYLGRNDRQVKIRGYRIELNEIEACLNKHPFLANAAVAVREEAGKGAALTAYFTSKQEIAIQELRDWIAGRLPSYMVPTSFVKLEALPISANGKIAYGQLPDPFKGANENIVRPRNEKEKALAEIWSEVLGIPIEMLGVFDDFFEMGGDSIIAMRILPKAKSRGIEINIKDIFLHRTIGALCENANPSVPRIKPEQKAVEGLAPLHPTEQWFFEKKMLHPEYFNMAYLFSLPENVHIELLEEVFMKCLDHHDALRSTFAEVEGARRQVFHPASSLSFKLEERDFSQFDHEQQKRAIIAATEEIQCGFDLEEGPLFKAAVFDLGQKGKRLFVAAHHLIIDGVSWRYLVEDIELLYSTRLKGVLPEKTHSLIEYHGSIAKAATTSLETHYWHAIDPSAADHIFLSGERSSSKNYREIAVSFDKEFTGRLLAVSKANQDTNVNEVLLTSMFYSLCNAFQCKSLLFNHEGHGRMPIDGIDPSRTIGWLTTIYPVFLRKQTSIGETLKFVKDTLKKLYPIDTHFGISRFVHKDSSLKRLNPEILFNYFGRVGADLLESNKNLLSNCPESFGPLTHPLNSVPHLLEVNAIIMEDALNISVLHDPKAMPPGSVDAWIEEFKQELQHLMEAIDEEIQHDTNYSKRQ